MPLTGTDELPAQLGRYRVEGEIGRGGMGVVYRVHDPALKRTLAVKVLLRHHQDNPDLKRRFLEEAELMAQLQHPGIAPLHDVGELPEGRPYFSMKLIRGRTLAQLLQERPSPTHDLPGFLAIFGQLCQTLAYAHDRRILHRDLKPSNVMVGAFGEVQVMDWGLAKVLDSQRTSEADSQPDESSAIAPVRTAGEDLATHAGAILGTPAFMAPEQARGEIERLDERADVFGLGAILCVLLTGQPPYVGLTKAEVFRQAKEGALTDAHARLQACGADEDLVRLAKACLTPELGARPRHAGLVAEAVATYQAQVQERLQQAEVARAQADVKVQEERKRRRVTLALAAAVVVLLLGGSVAGWWYQEQAAAQQRRLGEAQQGIEASLTEAGKLREAGLKQVDNPSAWGTTLAAARTALEHARTLLSQEPDLAETALAQQAQQAKAQLEADAKDWQLLAVYDRVRLEQSQWDLQRRQFRLAEAYPRLQQALADYGLAIGGLELGQAAARLRQRPKAVQPHLRAVLEECLAWVPKEQGAQRQWLEAVLAVDADPWLKQFRQARAKRAWAEVEQLAAQAEVARYHPAVLVGLAGYLRDQAPATALLLLRRTQQQYPGDFWVNLELGSALYASIFPRGADRPARGEELPVVNEAVAFLRVAVGLRPGNAPAHNNLGLTLAAQGDLPGAIACFKKALDLDPNYAETYNNLGIALKDKGDVAGAIACFKKALDLKPKYAQAHTNLGVALKAQGDVKGAIACYHKALDLDPKDAKVHTNLGRALMAQGDVKGAIACFRKALELDPKRAVAHHSLGVTLARQGDVKGAIACFKKALDLDPKYATAHTALGAILCDVKRDYDGAIACFKKALELDPKNATVHYNLGNALKAQGDLPGAIACYQKALDLDPKLAQAHYNLGRALAAQEDLPGAIACYQKALDLDPMHAEAHCNLGSALREQGHFVQALQALKRGHQLGSKRPDWRYPSARWVEDCQRLLDLDTRVPALLKGEDQPKDTAEQLALADLCQRYKKRYAAAVRFYQAAFAAKPKLTPEQQAFHHYNAACAAVLAAAGKGEDASKLEGKEKSRLRQQALAWLRESLQQYARLLADADARTRQAARQTLQHWQKDSDLDSVRGKDALAKLPEAERAAWQQFWAEVETLRQKAAAANSP
jgi:tetratricopeptide (TPR) repeat protein